MTTLHSTTFEDLQPTEQQKAQMSLVREAAKVFAKAIEDNVPAGPDKTYLLRKHREVAMWANVAITREADGSPKPADGAPVATPTKKE